MKPRVVLPILVATIAGLTAIYALRPLLDNANRKPVDNKVPIVVAASDLASSTQITEEMLMIARISPDLVPENAFKDPQTLVGRVLRSRISAKLAITEDFLAPIGSSAAVDASIPPGYTAVAVRVDEWSSVAGLVGPGSHVNVIAEVLLRNNTKKSRTILQNVEVFAVGTFTSQEELDEERLNKDNKKSNFRSVTLLLTPKEAEVLHQVGNSRLMLALRSGTDESIFEPEDDNPVAQAMPRIEPVAQTPPPAAREETKRFRTLEIHGDSSKWVTYVFVDGRWMPENSKENYLTDLDDDMAQPLPQVRTYAADEPNEDVVQSAPEVDPVEDDASDDTASADDTESDDTEAAGSDDDSDTETADEGSND